MSRRYRFALRALLLAAGASTAVCGAHAQTLFFEDWDDGSGSTRWSSPLMAQENEEIAFEGTVDYAFDYSTIGAPSAPNSTGGSTTGVFMQTNIIESGDVNEGEAIGILPLSFDLPSGDYELTADVYLYWDGNSGSTEFAMLGVHHQRSDRVPLWFPANTHLGDGIAYDVNTDGDTVSGDYNRYVELGGAGQRDGLGTYEEIPNGDIPGVPTGDAQAIGPHGSWVELSITREDGVIEFAMNDYVLDTFTDGVFFTGGTFLVAQSDPFNSSNGANGAVFDNIRVALPVDPIPGDYNEDGVVDAADYTIYRDTEGDSVTAGTGADGNGNGFIEPGDYTVWADAYGSLASPPALAVPEPATAAMLIVASFAAWARGRRA